MSIKLASVALAISLLCPWTAGRTIKSVHTPVADCEDLAAEAPVNKAHPCITQDEGKWLLVTGFSPYKAERIAVCGKGIRPCVEAGHKLPSGKWDYLTK